MIRYKDNYDWNDITYSFSEACDNRFRESFRGGQIEELETKVENLQDMLRTLLHILNERAEFSPEEAEQFFGSRYKAIHLEEM